MTDFQKMMAKQYFERMAQDIGADVEVEISRVGGFVVYRKGRIERFFHVDEDVSGEAFYRKVRWLMED